MAKNVKSLWTQKKQTASKREFVLHQVEGFTSEKNECWYFPTDTCMLLVSTGKKKKIILIGIYMHAQDGVPYSALDYSSPFSFGAGSVLPISRCHKQAPKQALSENSNLQMLGSSRSNCTCQTSTPFCTLSHLRTLQFSSHLYFPWNWMTKLNRLSFFQHRNPQIVFWRERKERSFKLCIPTKQVAVVVSSTFAPSYNPLGSKWRPVLPDPMDHFCFLSKSFWVCRSQAEIHQENPGDKLKKHLTRQCQCFRGSEEVVETSDPIVSQAGPPARGTGSIIKSIGAGRE